MDLGQFDLHEEELGLDYCLTLVRDLDAVHVARRLGGTEIVRLTGLDRMERYHDAVGDERGFALVADLPGGALIVEVYACRTVFADTNRPLSAGTTIAVVYESENNDPEFLWVEDGDVRVSFNPQAAGWREGSDPDALLADLERLGFDLAEEGDYDEYAHLRALALATNVTGLQLRAGMLRELTYSALSLPAVPGDTGEAPPIRIGDVEPSVDQYDTVTLDGVPGTALGEALIIQPYADAIPDLALTYTVHGIRTEPVDGDDEWVCLFVKVTARGVRGHPTAGPANFAFVAADGAVFRAIWSSEHPSMEGMDISPGESTSGEMLFSVPPDTVNADRLIYGRLAYIYDEVPLAWWALTK